MKVWLALGLLWSLSVQAVMIEVELTDLGGGRWQSEYSVINDGATAVEGFSIDFDFGLYANLTLLGQPDGWDSFVSDPTGFPLSFPGVLDSLALSGGLAPGERLTGWQVAFDYLGSGRPGIQPFQIYDPLTFSVWETGQTRRSVPEPPVWLLWLGSVLALRRWRRRFRGSTSALD